MNVTCGERTRVYIGETTVKHQAIITSLLAAHALEGCDTIARLTSIAKCKAFTQIDSNEVVAEAITFIAGC